MNLLKIITLTLILTITGCATTGSPSPKQADTKVERLIKEIEAYEKNK